MRGRSQLGSDLDKNGHRLATAQAYGRVGDAHGDGIATEQALMQDLDIGAFDEAQLDQTTFEFARRQAGAAAFCIDCMYATAKAHAGRAKCYGWLGVHCE